MMNGPEGHSARSFSGLLGTSGHHQRSPAGTSNHDRASDKLDIEMTKHETDVRSTALVRIRPAEFFARVLSQQPGNYNAKKLLDNGSKLLRTAFGLDEVLLGTDCGHSDAEWVKSKEHHNKNINSYILLQIEETEPALTNLPHNSNMEVLRYLRLQVFTVSPTDDLPYTCFETGTGPMKLCTAVISTSPQNSASVELFMGGEAPAEGPFIECPNDPKDAESLTVAVYQSDSRIAHAIIPLSEVWEKVMDQSNSGGGLPRGGSGAASANILAYQGDAGQSGAWGGANTGWPGSPYPGEMNPTRSGVQSDVLHTVAQPIGAGDTFKKGSLEPAKGTAVAPKMKLRCPYCRSWFSRTKARLLCSSCKHCHGTRVYRDPFKGDHMLTSAFDQHNQLVQSLQCDALPKLEGPLWWLAADADGQLVLHATLSDPGSNKLAGVIGIRIWKIENEVPAGFPRQGAASQQDRRTKHDAMPMPLGGSSLPGHQVQLTVMQAYRITMQSVLRASGCCPRKLNPEEPWSWLLGNFIQQHRIPTPSVHLCWLQWYLQEDIRSLLPEALELIRNKLDVLRASHLDGFERTQLDALQLDVRLASDDMIMPVQIPTKHVETREGEVHVTKSSEFRPGPQLDKHRYYRLDGSGERGLCDRAARSCERCPAALKPAVSLAHLVKDLTHPQDQGWLRALICDAASNRFKHLEAGSGLRGGASIVTHARTAAGLKKGNPASSSWDDLARVVSGNLTQGVTDQKKGQPPALMQEDSWARPPGQQGHAEWSAWLDKHRLDKDHLTVSLATLCDLVKRELEGDLAIHRAHVLPASVILPVVTAEVYCKALSTLITFVLERVRPDPTASSTTTVVAIAKLENYLRKNIFGAFSREQPFSAHNLLESTVQRWVDADRKELLEQLRATCQSLGRHGGAASSPAPGCDLQEAITPALRNRLKPYEAIVTHLPLTSTLVEKFATDVIRAAMMESCRIQGVARRGGRGPRYHGGNTGVDVAANMRRDGWTWNHPAKEAVRGGAGLRRCEIVMLNSFRRLLSNIATLNGDIGRWAGAENLPQPNNNTRINMFAGRANGGPPTGINDYDERSNVTQADLYASPSMAGGRAGMGTPTGSHVSDYPIGAGEKPGPFSDAGSRVPGSPVKGAPPSPPGAQGPLPIGGHSGDPGLTPYGVNFAQLNQEVRHIYSYAVIETAKRVADNVLRESGGMQRIVDSAASTISSNYKAPYAVGPAQGDARVTSAQRLHDGLLALLTGTRRVLEDKAFVALARGIWDHIGSVAQTAIENLHNGAEDPRAWRTQQGIEQMLADLEDFFKQGLQSFVQDSSLVQRDLQAPARFAAARALVSSNMGSNSFQPI